MSNKETAADAFKRIAKMCETKSDPMKDLQDMMDSMGILKDDPKAKEKE